MPKREYIIDRIEKTFKHLMRNSEVLKKFVNICGITSCSSTNVCGTGRFQGCMISAFLEELYNKEVELPCI